MTETEFRALPPLRRAVRHLAEAHRLPAELRARLVLSVTTLAGTQLTAGRRVTLHTTREPGPDAHSTLAVTLRSPQATGPLDTAGLPLPAQSAAAGSAMWRLPVPVPGHRPVAPPAPRHGGNGTGEPSEVDVLEEELRAALARADSLAAEHHRLKHELAETNSGVLALYVQLEERDEQLRSAHGQTLRELEDALRPPPVESDGLELAVHYAPAGTDAPTGGDLYDWFTMPDGTVHITVVDALGHGVRSTRSALNVTHAVRTLALEGHPLQSIIARTNEILMPFDNELMATVLLARADPVSGEVHLANGSHPPALLLRADGTPEYLEVRGRGIGFPLPGSEKLLRTRLEPGDLLLLYTDGLTESRRDPVEGEARLIESARRHRRLPIADLPGAVAGDMHSLILHADDTLALAVRRRGTDGGTTTAS